VEVALDQQEISIYSKQYEYIIDEESKIITLPSPPGMHAGMKRHYYFKKVFNEYHLTIVNRKSWEKLKNQYKVKVLKIKEKE
jgi:hypothetical protein